MNDFRSFDQLGWSWEWLSDSCCKKDGLVLVIHTLMHHRAVAVTLHVRCSSLVRVTPTRLANLFAWHTPCVEPLEMLPRKFCIVLGHQVHKRISKSRGGLK